MQEDALQIETKGAVTTIWLNRPEVHNAFDDRLILELTQAFISIATDRQTRVVVLAAHGRSFSAGGQVEWMRAQGEAPPSQNRGDALRLAEMFQAIDRCPKPTVARVQGAALGGGVGLVAACDIAVGTHNAIFGTTEVRLGLLPATIGPYVVRAIGERQARRFFLTGERFDAVTAQRTGLLHEVVEPEQLDAKVIELCQELLKGGPEAQADSKALLQAITLRTLDRGLLEQTADRIAVRRASPEAKEGLGAFLEKRPAAWVKCL